MDKGIKGLGAFECEGHRSGGLLKSKAGMREAQVMAAYTGLISHRAENAKEQGV